MIINAERNPSMSLYFTGGVVLEILFEKDNILIENLYEATQSRVRMAFHIDFFYYTLDWLYLLSSIKLENGRVCLCE